MPRDLTRKQYEAAMAKHGFRWGGGVLGYWILPGPREVRVSEYNAPRDTNRSRLAYMLAALDRERERAAAPTAVPR